jgi:hypothetical protein
MAQKSLVLRGAEEGPLLFIQKRFVGGDHGRDAPVDLARKAVTLCAWLQHSADKLALLIQPILNVLRNSFVLPSFRAQDHIRHRFLQGKSAGTDGLLNVLVGKILEGLVVVGFQAGVVQVENPLFLEQHRRGIWYLRGLRFNWRFRWRLERFAFDNGKWLKQIKSFLCNTSVTAECRRLYLNLVHRWPALCWSAWQFHRDVEACSFRSQFARMLARERRRNTLVLPLSWLNR